MSFPVTDWRIGDSEPVMLAKLVQIFGGSPKQADGTPVLLRKLLQAGNAANDGSSSSALLNFKDDGNDAAIFTADGVTEVARFTDGTGLSVDVDTIIAPVWNDGATIFTALSVNAVDTASHGSSVLLSLKTASDVVPTFIVGKNGQVVITAELLEATNPLSPKQLLTARQTGWTAPTGTASRATFDTATVTTAELAQRVHALIDDLTTHGLIGA
jgi:hypothetical protein